MGVNPNSLANLKPFGPDNPPPNSPGRPRKRPLSEAHDDLLRRPLPPEFAAALRQFGLPKNPTWADAFSAAMAREVLKGNVLALKELGDRAEGKATQRIELMTHEDKQVEITVTFENPVPAATLPEPVDKIIDVEVEQVIKNEIKESAKPGLPLGMLLDES